MSNEKQIEQLKAWCQGARSIIGLGLKGSSSRMEHSVNKLATMLTKLDRRAKDSGAESELLKSALKDFADLSGQLNLLQEQYEAAKGNKTLQKQKRQAIKDLVPQLKKLEDNLIADEPVARAMHFFELKLSELGDLVAVEKTQALSDGPFLKKVESKLIEFEKLVAENPKYRNPAAVTKLTGEIDTAVGNVVRKSIKDSRGRRDRELEQSRRRAQAELRRDEVTQLLEQFLASGSILPSDLKAYQTALIDCEKLFVQDRWIEGMDVLDRLPTEKDCEKSFEAARVEANKDFGPQIELVNQGLAFVREFCSTELAAQLSGVAERLIGRAGAPNRKIKDTQTLMKDFEALILETKTQTSTAHDQAKSLESRVKQIDDLLNSKGSLLPTALLLSELVEHRRQLEMIRHLQTERDWDEAVRLADDLGNLLETADLGDYSTWLGEKVGLLSKATSDALRRAIAAKGTAPKAASKAETLLQKVSPKSIAALEESRNWAELMRCQIEVSTFIGSLDATLELEVKQAKDQAQRYAEFSNGRQAANKVVLELVHRCTDELDVLRQQLESASVAADPVLAPLNLRLDTIEKAWAERQLVAVDADELQQPETEDALELLLVDIAAAGEQPSIDIAVVEHAENTGRAQFDTERQRIERELLARLADISIGSTLTFRREIDVLFANRKIETDPALPWAQRIAALGEISRRATTALGSEVETRGQLIRDGQGKVALIRLELQGAMVTLREQTWLPFNKYEPMFNDLLSELADLEGLLTASNATALAGNLKLLQQLDDRAKRLLMMTIANQGMSRASVDGRELRLENLGKRLERLKSRKLAKYVPESTTSLQEQFEALKRDLFRMEPDVVTQDFDAYSAMLDRATEELETLLAGERRAKELELELKQQLADVRLNNATATVYFDKVGERIGGAAKLARQPAQILSSVRQLETLSRELAEIEKNPETALGRQASLLQEVQAQERMSKEYKGRYETIKNSRLSVIKKLTAKEGGSGEEQVDEVHRMLDLAAKSAKGGDLDRALQILIQTERRITEIEQNPAGTGLGNRKVLDKHLGTLARSIEGVRAELKQFAESARPLLDRDGSGAATRAVTSAVEKVSSKLNPRMFDAYAPSITDKGVDKAERRARRDEALQRLREFRSYISSHPEVVKIASNPVLSIVPALKLVHTSLIRVEAHLRSAIT